MKDSGKRYIGLEAHRRYLIAIGADQELKIVLSAQRVEISHLETWMKQTLIFGKGWTRSLFAQKQGIK